MTCDVNGRALRGISLALCVALSACGMEDELEGIGTSSEELLSIVRYDSGARSLIPPVLLKGFDGRLHVLVMDAQSNIRYDVSPTAGDWTAAPNTTLVGNYAFPAQGGPTMMQQADGRMVVIVRYTSNLYRSVQSGVNSRSWGPWEFHGNLAASEPVLGRNQGGRLELFYPATDGTFRHMWQTSNNGPWSSAVAFPGMSCQGVPTAILDIGGKQQVYCRGSDGYLWRVVQQAPDSTWLAAENISAGLRIQPHPGVAQNSDGRLEITVRQESSGIYQRWENPIGTWSAWANVTPPSSPGGESGPTMLRDSQNRLWVFVGTDIGVFFRYQLSAGGWSGWSPWWQNSGGPQSSNTRVAVPAVVPNAGLPVFLQGYLSSWDQNPAPGFPGYKRFLITSL
jgi:hypothetical protein